VWPVAGRDVRAAIGGDGGEAADDDVFTGVAVGGAWQAGDAFFALDLGEDGHVLADRYLAAGGKLAVVSAQDAGPRTIRVGDVLGAFKRLAGFMRARMSWRWWPWAGPTARRPPRT
jgi:UDP-N-acetylmuramyl pentapeptide synthase